MPYPISVPVKNLNKGHYEDLRLWNNNFMLRSGANILCFYRREVIPEEKHQKKSEFQHCIFYQIQPTDNLLESKSNINRQDTLTQWLLVCGNFR